MWILYPFTWIGSLGFFPFCAENLVKQWFLHTLPGHISRHLVHLLAWIRGLGCSSILVWRT